MIWVEFMSGSNVLAGLGIIFLEIGVVLFVSLLSAYIFNKMGIPAALGLLSGGMGFGYMATIQGYTFSADFDAFREIITQLALGFIAYDIGNEIDFRVLKEKLPKFWKIIVGSIGTFFLVTFAIFLFFRTELWFAMMFGAIAMTTAPTVTSDILGDYHTDDPLSSAILFVLSMDAILAVILMDLALSLLFTNGTGVNFMINIMIFIAQKIMVSLFLSSVALLVLFLLLSWKSLNEKSIVEWILGFSLIIIGMSLIFQTSIILAMLFFGMGLKTMETKFDKLEEHVLHIEILLIPVVLLFYVLFGMIIDLNILLGSGLFIFLTYFLLRFFGKTVITFYSTKLSTKSLEQEDICQNLHLSLVTQAGIALSLVGLSYNNLISLNYPNEAKLIVSAIGISIIVSQIIGPIMLRLAIFRCKVEKTKFSFLSAKENEEASR